MRNPIKVILTLLVALGLSACVVEAERSSTSGTTSSSPPASANGSEEGPGGDSMAKLKIVNDTDEELAHLYVCPADSDDWGDDMLSGIAILPGNDEDIELTPGTWDFKIVWGSGEEDIREDVEFTGSDDDTVTITRE